MQKNFSIFMIIISLTLIFSFSMISLAKNRHMTLNVGEGNEQISFTFDTSSLKSAKEKGRYTISSAIQDFTIPANQLDQPLTRSNIGGDEMINEIQIINNKGQTTMFFRLSTKGTGGGDGNIGGSVVVAVNLDKELLKGKKGSFISSAEGKLTSSEGKISNVIDYVVSDLETTSAKSETYTMLAGAGDSDTLFYGFALFDPTNPDSLENAYFEFSSSQSTLDWLLK
jgi:hypothetical protein